MRTYITVLLLTLLITGCGGGGNGTPATGTVTGSLTVGGPIDRSVSLNIGLFTGASATPAYSTDLGKVTSASRDNSFSFSQVAMGTYKVRAYGVKPGFDNAFYFTSDDITLTTANPSVTGLKYDMGFTGPEPWGTISGVATLTGDWPTDRDVFLGFRKNAVSTGPDTLAGRFFTQDETPTMYLRYEGGKVIYNIDHLAYGTYRVGLYGYNPAEDQFDPADIETYGEWDDTVLLHGGDTNITNISFPADFAGDPGPDPDLGAISGTVTFNGDLPPSSGFYAVAANTVPPQAGAPPSSVVFTPGEVNPTHELSFILEGLNPGDYAVAVFSYSIATHTAVYFGQYNDTITITGSEEVQDIDFTADIGML